MAKKGYLGNPNLKRIGTNIQWTPEMEEEWIKCSEDPIYFTETYLKIINLNDGLVNFVPYDYQRQIIETIHDERFTIILTGRQSGKCLEYNQRLTLKNKKTGELLSISIGNFADSMK